MSFIWDNYYYADERVNEYELSLFIKEEDNLFRKYTEMHYQKAYLLEEIRQLIEESGLIFLEAKDNYTNEDATKESGRIVVLAKEQGKNIQ